MRQRGQIARGAHRALGRNHRQHIGIGQGQQRIDDGGANARVAARQAHRLGSQNEAHHAVGQRIARAHAVRQHKVALQLGQAVVGNLGAGQLAKAGVDAVDHLVLVHDALHHGLCGLHARQRTAVELQGHAACMDAAQFCQADGARHQVDGGWQ